MKRWLIGLGILFLAAPCLFIGGCYFSWLGWFKWTSNEAVKRYGVAFNSERTRLGLPSLPESWVLAPGFEADRIRWVNPGWQDPREKSGAKGRYMKTIEVKDGRLVSEDDQFFSGRLYKQPYHDPDEQLTETITIRAYFDLSGKIRTWECFHGCENSTRTSLDEARATLKTWGLPGDN